MPQQRYSNVHSGRRPALGGLFLRSSWENNVALILNEWIREGRILRWEYEPETFRFPVKRGNRSYTPDFRVWITDDEYEWHEVKGYMDTASRIKIRRFELHFPKEFARFKLIDKPVYNALVAEYKPRDLPGWE